MLPCYPDYLCQKSKISEGSEHNQSSLTFPGPDSVHRAWLLATELQCCSTRNTGKCWQKATVVLISIFIGLQNTPSSNSVSPLVLSASDGGAGTSLGIPASAQQTCAGSVLQLHFPALWKVQLSFEATEMSAMCCGDYQSALKLLLLLLLKSPWGIEGSQGMEYFVSTTGNMQNSVQEKVPILRCHSYYYTKAETNSNFTSSFTYKN